eukprot:195371_1
MIIFITDVTSILQCEYIQPQQYNSGQLSINIIGDCWIQDMHVQHHIINQIACDKPLIFNDNNSINNLNIKSLLISHCNVFTQSAITKHLPNELRELSLEFFLSSV